MALFLSSFLLLVSLLFCACNAATVTYNFTAGWVLANPDNMFDKPTMGLNGQWPLPTIEVNKGDRLVVNLHNGLGNQSTGLHFHGIYQNGTTYMDGVVGVTQCTIPPGSSLTYDFVLDQAGTYWYHSHQRGQYPDGLRGAFIVHDPDSPYADVIDEEVVMTLSDHYHEQMPPLIASFINVVNPTGAEPVPKSALMNDGQNKTFAIVPEKTYLFRIVNMAAFAAQYVWFEGHTMEIVEVDGVWTERQPTEMIYVAAAQRYGVLITAKNATNQNYAIVGSMDQDLFDTVPASLNPNVTGWLVYDDTKPNPTPALLDTFNPYDDFNLVPTDGEELWEEPSQTVILTLKMDNLGNGANYAFLNNVSWVAPKVPTLFSALTTGEAASNPMVYGVNSNPIVLGHNQVVELVLNNDDTGTHPFHLHGHNFQTVIRTDADAGDYDPSNVTANGLLPRVPMRRDTLVIKPNGHFAIRWRSDNPGIWLFHCHIEWHVDSGLVATVIEAPLALQEKIPLESIPAEHLQICRTGNVPIEGNAAGNTKDFYDLEGANVSVPPLPSGFEAKGIVALVFSCISAVLGMIVIGWYGMKPLSNKAEVQLEGKVEHLADLKA